MAAWLLLAALLPSLLYVGHWSIRVPLPGDEVAVVGVDEHAHEHPGEPEGHAQHCHGESSCSDVQSLAIGGFAVMSRVLALLGASGLLLALAAGWWRPAHGAVVSPERKPPRLLEAGIHI